MTKVRSNQTEVEEILNDPLASASTTKKGSMRIATQGEVDAGTAGGLAVTADTLFNRPSELGDLIVTSIPASDTITSTKDIFAFAINGVEGGALEKTTPIGFDAVSLTSDSISAAIPANSISGMWWKPGGLVYYVMTNIIDGTTLEITEYIVSTPYNIGTPVGNTAYNIAGVPATNAPNIFWFSQDGTKLVINNSNDLYEFALATAWDLTNISFTQQALNILAQAAPRTITVTPDGAYLYNNFWNTSNHTIYQYKINVDGDVSSIAFINSFDFTTIRAPLDGVPRGLAASIDGTKFFVAWDDNFSTRHLIEMAMNPAYDISTQTEVAVNSTTLGYSNQSTRVNWNIDGLKFYEIIAGSVDTIFQYSSNGTGGGTTLVLYHDGVTKLEPTINGVNIFGQLIFPNYSTANLPTTTIDGGTVYDSDTKSLKVYNGTIWAEIGSITNPLSSDLDTNGFTIITVDSSTTTPPNTITLQAGADTYSGGGYTAGKISIIGGDATNGNFGGGVYMQGGAGLSNSNGGRVQLSGGNAVGASYSAGSIYLMPGSNTTGQNGNIQFHAPENQIGQASFQIWDHTNTAHTVGTYVELKAPSATGSPLVAPSNWTMTLPPNSGTGGYFLQTDGLGNTSWSPTSVTNPLTSDLDVSGYNIIGSSGVTTTNATIDIIAGSTIPGQNGGNINLTGGLAPNGYFGGNIILTPGAGSSGAAYHGNVQVNGDLVVIDSGSSLPTVLNVDNTNTRVAINGLPTESAGTLQVTGDLHVEGGVNYRKADNTVPLATFMGGTNFFVVRDFSDVYTVQQIWSKPGDVISGGDREATLALVRGDEPNQEFLDLYNNGYAVEKQFGIRMQKRGTGLYRNFVIDYDDGTTKTTVLTIQPDQSTTFSGVVNLNADPVNPLEAATRQYVLANVGIQNVVEDITPQLGGNLDVNGFDIITPNITTGAVNTLPIELRAGTNNQSSQSAGDIVLFAGRSYGAAIAGNIRAYGGEGNINPGGIVRLRAGSGGSGATGGAASLEAGGGYSGGICTIKAGFSTGGAVTGARMLVYGGDSVGGEGGSLDLFGGRAADGYIGGDINITPGGSNNPNLAISAFVNIHTGTNNTGPAVLRLSNDTNTFHTTSTYVELKAPTGVGSPPVLPTNWTMTLPPNTGTTGQVLTTDGAGITSWGTVSGGGGITNPLTADLDTAGFVVKTANNTSGSASDIKDILLTGGQQNSSTGGYRAGDIILTGGYGANYGYGGDINLTAGNSYNNSSGNINITAGQPVSATAQSGSINITAGASSGGTPGIINITGASTAAGQGGGVVNIIGGDSPSGYSGGFVVLTPGGDGTAYGNGYVDIHSPVGATGEGIIRIWDDTNAAHTTGTTVSIKATAGQSNWTMTLPANSGTTGQVLSTDGVGITTWKDNSEDLGINAQTGTAYTLLLSDKNKLITMNNASANTLTIPTNASVAFPIGSQLLVEQDGTGQTTIAPAGGVTINSTGGFLSFATQYTTITLVKKAIDTWLLIGDLV